MATTRDRTSSLIEKLLQWVVSRTYEELDFDEYSLFLEVAQTNPRIQQRVSSALKSHGAPGLPGMTRSQYYALTTTQFDEAVKALLAELNMSLEAARELSCVKLQWCKRRSRWGWKSLVAQLARKVPAKLRGLVTVAGGAAPWIWDALNILIQLSPHVTIAIFLVKLSAYLASGALDKLCGCPASGG
jgi:hypothetical protein